MKLRMNTPAVLAAVLVAGLATSYLSAQQNDTTQSQLSGAEANLSESSANAIGLTQFAKLQAEASWGLTTMRLPSYLRRAEWGLSPKQGLLVTQIVRGLPAAHAGIEIGCLIVEIDGKPVLEGQTLPILGSEHNLIVLGEDGTREVLVKPLIESLLGVNPVVGQLLNGSGALTQVVPPLGIGLNGLANPVAIQPTPRSLAASQANGEYSISAVVDGVNGPTRVELRGCRAEIIKQLKMLPVDVQNQLTPYIGL